MFAAGVRKKTPEKENATEFIGQIDPATLISIIRVQNEQKNQIPEPLVDPLPDIERRQKKKSKKQRKRQQKNSESDKPLFKTGEIEAKKGVYYLHQANGALFCTDKAGDAENRIFQKIYNGELPIYKRINRGILGAAWIKPKDKKKVKNDGPGRYYAKSNRKIIRSAPAATARAVRTRNKVQEAVDNQTPHLIIYETELVEEFEQNTEIDILQLKTRDFNRKLQEDKTNINLWLEFVAFQDELFEDQIEKSENGRNISKKNLNEKKVAIIDRALDVNTKSVRLRVALLNQAREIWTPEELGKRWETLVFSNPHLPELWRFFMETQYNTPLKSILKYYVKQFETLGAISEGSYAATPPENLEEEMIINLDHLETGQLALRGHTERTTAIYQGNGRIIYIKS